MGSIVALKKGVEYDLRANPGSLQRKDGKLRADVKRAWLDGLRSGEFRQTRGCMGRGNTSRDVVGVLASKRNLIVGEPLETAGGLDPQLLDPTVQAFLIDRNDCSKWNFPKLAEWIETNL